MATEYVVTSHWSTLIENLSESPQKFYELIESAVTQRQLPEVTMERTCMKEAGPFSAEREYFSVTRKTSSFDICAAPYGNAFFVSWWQSYSPTLLQRLALAVSLIPVIGGFVPRSMTGDFTFYQQDTAQMFQKSIHSAVLSVIDDLTKVRGARVLSDSERKPINNELLNKPLTR